jgi:surfeit locus 1 family protein
VRSAEHRGVFTGANDPDRNIYYLRRPAEFVGLDLPSEGLGGFVDLLSPVPPGGLPGPTAGRIDIPNRHLEYVLTWYGLALTLVGVFVAFARGRLKAA